MPTIMLSVAELSSIELRDSNAGGGWLVLMGGDEQYRAVASIIVFQCFV
jgi:hypothetical protein